MDAEGCYWAAMFEGGCLLRIAPTGEVVQRMELPVSCPTMPTFGGPDLRTLFITTAREKRPAEELAAPAAGWRRAAAACRCAWNARNADMGLNAE